MVVMVGGIVQRKEILNFNAGFSRHITKFQNNNNPFFLFFFFLLYVRIYVCTCIYTLDLIRVKCPSARFATTATPPSTPTPGSEEGDWRGFPIIGGRGVYVCVVWCGGGEGEHIPK